MVHYGLNIQKYEERRGKVDIYDKKSLEYQSKRWIFGLVLTMMHLFEHYALNLILGSNMKELIKKK